MKKTKLKATDKYNAEKLTDDKVSEEFALRMMSIVVNKENFKDTK